MTSSDSSFSCCRQPTGCNRAHKIFRSIYLATTQCEHKLPETDFIENNCVSGPSEGFDNQGLTA